MRKQLLLCAALTALAVGSAWSATVNVTNLGPILNDSVSFPSIFTTPGTNADYFEFSLPHEEFVSASLSISGPIGDQLKGVFDLMQWTSTDPLPPFIPMGPLLESALLTPHAGGETAVLGTESPQGDFLRPGEYFAVADGVVPAGARINLSLSGNATGMAAPELSTWMMLATGFALLTLAGRRRRTSRAAVGD